MTTTHPDSQEADNQHPTPQPDLPTQQPPAPLRDDHIRPNEKIGLALNYIAKSDIPVGLFLTGDLRVLPTNEVRRIVMAGDLLAYNPAFVNCVSITGCRVVLLHEIARLITPRAIPGADPVLYEIACDLWINSELRPHYRRIIPDESAFLEEFIEGPLRALGFFAGEPPCESAPQQASLEEVHEWVLSHRELLPEEAFEPAFDGEIQFADPGKFAGGNVYKTEAVLRELAGEPVSPPPENPETRKSNFANARLDGAERGFILHEIKGCPQEFFKSLGLPELLEKFPDERWKQE